MYQIGRLIIGNEFDWSWTRLNGSGEAAYSINFTTPIPLFAKEAYSISTKWTGTATATMGITKDRWMFYSKAGVAWVHQDYTLTASGSGFGFNVFPGTNISVPFNFGSANTSEILIGWTLGAGVKWAMLNNWFLNVEYNYMDFGSKVQNFNTVCAAPTISTTVGFGPCNSGNPVSSTTFSPTFSHRISQVKAGLNYKFGPEFFYW